MNSSLKSKLVMTLAVLVMIVAVVAIPLSVSITRTHAQGAITISEFPTPTSGSQPNTITSGPDGNLWFTLGNNYIGTITSSGTFTEYTVPTSNSGPTGITSGPDGNLWFVEGGANQIGRVNLSSPPPIVIVQKVSTTDGNNNIKTSFAPGDAIHYRVRVNNTNSTKVPATFTFLATGPQQIFSWSGYVVEGTAANPVTYTDVKGSWIVPTAKCSKGETSRSATWVGIGGIVGDTGTPNYYEWYEMVGSPNPNPMPINCPQPLKAGDTVYLAEVSFGGNNQFTFEINTSECDFATVQTGNASELNSAEWIVEDPPNFGCTPQCPLTHFVTGMNPFINFSSCSANGNPITANPLLGSFAITDDGTANGVLKAFPLHTTSGDTAFSVKWSHSQVFTYEHRYP
jgi:hypothetical protein